MEKDLATVKATKLMEHPLFSFASALPYNTGIAALRAEGLARGPRTTIVAGTPRGGTTMIAECLGALGLPIGVPIPPPSEMFNYEDPELQAVLTIPEQGQVNVAELRKLVDARNNAFTNWGFKFPLALNSLPLLEQELRGPAFVLVFRDALAVAARECIAMGTELTTAMQQAIVWQTRMVDFATSSSSPCLLVSYEKALQFPDLVTTALAGWTGLEVSAEQCRRAAVHVTANQESYLLGVRNQCDLFEVPQPDRFTAFAAGAPQGDPANGSDADGGSRRGGDAASSTLPQAGASTAVTRDPRDSAEFVLGQLEANRARIESLTGAVDVLRAELDCVRKEYAIAIQAVESERDRLIAEITTIVGSPGWKVITAYRQWFARSMAHRSWFVRAYEPLARWYLRRVDNRRPQRGTG